MRDEKLPRKPSMPAGGGGRNRGFEENFDLSH
jgi:hypothetical protein